MGQWVEMEPFERLLCDRSSVRSRVVMKEDLRLRTIPPLVVDVLLQFRKGLNISLSVDSRTFTEKFDPQRAQAVYE